MYRVINEVRRDAALKPTGFKVKALGRNKVKLECDYNPRVWFREFQYRMIAPYSDDQNGIENEWKSMYMTGSATSKILTDLECNKQYLFRIVHIGHRNERECSSEISRFVLASDNFCKSCFDAPANAKRRNIDLMDDQDYKISYNKYKSEANARSKSTYEPGT